MECRFAIAQSPKLTAQELGRGTMRLSGPVQIHDAHTRAEREGAMKSVHKLVRILDFVIHMRKDRNVDSGRRQLRVVRAT